MSYQSISHFQDNGIVSIPICYTRVTFVYKITLFYAELTQQTPKTSEINTACRTNLGKEMSPTPRLIAPHVTTTMLVQNQDITFFYFPVFCICQELNITSLPLGRKMAHVEDYEYFILSVGLVLTHGVAKGQESKLPGDFNPVLQRVGLPINALVWSCIDG